MTPRLRVLFVLTDLHGGGAQRVLLRILEALDRARFEPRLVVIERAGAFVERVPPDVPVLDAGKGRGRLRVTWIRRLAALLRASRPDVVVSFLWFSNGACLLARWLNGMAVPLVLSERVTIDGSGESILDEFLRRRIIQRWYRHADGLIANSGDLACQLVRRASVPASRVVAIPNPVDIAGIRMQARADIAERDARLPLDRPLVVALGRLVAQKGFDLAVRSMALVTRPCRLVIIGEGPEDGRLRRLAHRLGVADRVHFTGFLANPFPLLRRSTIFVLPSRYEGFPNALVEAMALGVPCIAARCPTGPEEILTDGVDGFLVPMEDASALAVAVDRVLSDADLRSRVGGAAARRSADFEARRIVQRYEAVIECAASRGGLPANPARET